MREKEAADGVADRGTQTQGKRLPGLRRTGCARIEELSGELAGAEEQVSRLVITREEVTQLLEEPPTADTAGQAGGSGGDPGHVPGRIGTVAVRPWQEGTKASVMPQAYQDLLESDTQNAQRPPP